MFKVVILPLAKQDIKEAALWYNSKQQELGKRFVLKVRQKINLVKRTPFVYSIRYDDIRVAIIDVFPFMVHFSVDGLQKLIIVYSVLNTSRDPDLWYINIED